MDINDIVRGSNPLLVHQYPSSVITYNLFRLIPMFQGSSTTARQLKLASNYAPNESNDSTPSLYQIECD